jgi:hypothetical protein
VLRSCMLLLHWLPLSQRYSFQGKEALGLATGSACHWKRMRWLPLSQRYSFQGKEALGVAPGSACHWKRRGCVDKLATIPCAIALVMVMVMRSRLVDAAVALLLPLRFSGRFGNAITARLRLLRCCSRGTHLDRLVSILALALLWCFGGRFVVEPKALVAPLP